MRQDPNIHLDRCPHCSVAKPNLSQVCGAETRDSAQRNPRRWIGYSCRTCGGVLLTVARKTDGGWEDIHKIWPSSQVVDDSVPDRAKQFLNQAINSIHAPSGAVMLAASSVDAMLKEIGLSQGNLYSRIKLAAEGHLITNEMAEWAHEVRLDANDQRHADEDAGLPDETDAQRSIEFVMALAQFLFVLPSRVRSGRGK
ncbi:DUF4145 domain-containing protein [Pseudomonas sp. OV546]|uniref:DUF4145 domain-containing protein n=1 Tax=Pseudomonas sp. OV546 TaxID=1881063 RepID=UPI0008E6978D|nr:DUF4145 domain-containing protein [Pseudomonas sp. OV546]SFU80778.1 protein of unknown function [Pseudomonas sp. OV546]